MLSRAHEFRDIIGHSYVTEFLEDHLTNGTLPQCLIFEGPEGLGKTCFADLTAINYVYGFNDSEERRKAIIDIIDNGKSNDSIKKYKMSVEGGKDAAKEVVSELNTSMTPYGKKVIILDECHRMSESAQDTFLVDTEYLPKGVLLIMITTESHLIKTQLKSRFFKLTLRRLKQADMLAVLRNYIIDNNLNIQGGDATLSLISTWADRKPRLALNLLSGFSSREAVSANTIKQFIGYLEVDDVLPIIKALSDSMTEGLTYISEIELSDSILDISIEILKIKKGQASYKLQFEEMKKVKEAISLVDESSIINFVYRLAEKGVTRQSLIAAFISSHSNFEALNRRDTKNMLEEELAQVSDKEVSENKVNVLEAPSMERLLMSSKTFGG